MKTFTLWAAIPAAFLLFLSGCGGSTTDKSGNEKLKLDKPSDVTVKRGDSAQVKVSIKRNNFGGDVNVAFSDLPKGVTIDPTTAKIGGSDNSTTFTLKAGNDAEVGDHNVKVTATGPDNLKPAQTFKVTVKDKS